MKPAYDKLAEEYAASSSVLIGDVDCTVHQDLCGKHEVRGYPTIKYFKDGAKTGEAYNGGREYDDLKKWVQETIEVACSIDDQSGCTDKEKKFITSMKSKDAAYLKSQVERLGKMAGGKMKAELKAWVNQRLNILKQLTK